MTREECKRILRRVELEAYSSVVSAFRAQGDLNKEKKKILHDLQQILSISTERHRAEVRRAVNDEKLATIADNMSPSNTTQEWLIEGRRLVPLMPRLVPQTAFTVTANQVANMQAEKNASLPSPSQTGIRENFVSTASSMSSPPSTPWTSRPSSPTSNVVVLPSGMSIHIKGGLNTEEDDDVQIRKRRRSTSTENLFSPPGATPIPQVTYTTTMGNMPAVSPKKITISKSPQAQPRVVASGSQTQKVILVSSQGHSPQVSLAQKSISLPVGRSTASTGTSTASLPKSVILPVTSSAAASTNTGSQATCTAPPYLTNTTSTVSPSLPVSAVGTSTTAFLTPTITATRPRFKTIPRQKIMQVTPPRPGVVIPMNPQPVQPSPQTLQGIKPGPKPTIQIRSEGGMKIITQSAAGASKILPKPSQITTPSGTPVVVVSAGSGAQTVGRTATLTGTPTGTKVLNIQTQGGKIITAPRGSSVVTVNPKTLHLTAVKNAAGLSGAKPNVIVVQKTQARRPGVATSISGSKATTAVISSPFEKELVSFLQKQDPTKQYVVTTTTANIGRASDTQRKVIVTTSGHGDLAKQISQTLQRSKSDASQPSSNILQDLIQAAGIVPDGNQDNQSGEVTLNLDESQFAALTSAAQEGTQSKASTSMPNNEWFEYDVTDEQGNTFTHTAESADTAAAIQSLLGMQANQSGASKPKVTVQRSSSVDLSQLSDHLNQQQFYTIEQAMNILNQSEKDQAASYIQTDSQNLGENDNGGEEILTAVPLNASVQQDMQGASSSVETQAKGQGSADDLDPQTGMFYVQKGGAISSIKILDGQQVVVSGDSDPRKYDLLSSSLAQAQIDLDPFQFIDDSSQGSKSADSSTSSSAVQDVVNSETVLSDEPVDQSLLGSSESVVVQKVVVSSPITTSTQPIRLQGSSFIPIQDVIRSSANKSTTSMNVTTSRPAVAVSSGSSIHVTVEPSGLDTSYMKMEDFTSQQLSDKADFVSDVGIGHMEEIASEETIPLAGTSGVGDSQVEGYQTVESQMISGRQKRKVFSGDEVTGSPPAGSGAPGGWTRAALGVLNKVSKYRGVNRDKTELNAASWFTQPVDPADAPDYYTIVENPMDFGTIKKKLETGKYLDFEDFHSDMVLVKDNCYLYNPEQSVVRKDCDEVFQFYASEYEKLMEKWQKTHIGSPVSKKPRTDRSPIHS